MIKKFLKYTFICLGGLVALLLIVAIFVPKTYTVSEQIIIAQPYAKVFDYIKLIKNQEHYSVWVMQDTNAILTYKGIDGTKGFKASWESKITGEGSQQITFIDSNKIAVDLVFIKPFEGHAKAANLLHALNDSTTQVVSDFESTSAYPLNLMNLMSKKFIAEAEQQNLLNLKNILEKK